MLQYILVLTPKKETKKRHTPISRETSGEKEREKKKTMVKWNYIEDINPLPTYVLILF